MLEILIVDDEFFNRRLLSRMLEPYGNCTEAVNGVEATNRFVQSVQEGKRFNLILMDIMMPKMDGLEAVARIREVEMGYQLFDADRAKVVMVTTLADHDSILAAKHIGIDLYLLKPFDRKKLISKIRHCGINLQD